MRDWFRHFHDSLWLRDDEGAEGEARFIRRSLRLTKGQSVLDAPCGAGRISLPLAKAGLNVTGVDLRDNFIESARSRFVDEGLSGDFVKVDIRELRFAEQFEAVVNWFGSFGYFSDGENEEIVLRFALALRPGGRLIIDQPNREYMLANFVEEHRFEELGGSPGVGPVHIRSYWNAEQERVEATWTLEQDAERTDNRLSIRIYTVEQLSNIYQNSGLVLESMYGSWTGHPYSRTSDRLILVGRKDKQ